MSNKALKKITLAVLLAVAFLGIFCFIPAEDSPTWEIDLLTAWSIGFGAFGLLMKLYKRWNIFPPVS